MYVTRRLSCNCYEGLTWLHVARTINVSSGEEPGALSEEVLELANGCLCCSIKDSGAASIEKMMQKRGRFDYILLETTGLADPGQCVPLL